MNAVEVTTKKPPRVLKKMFHLKDKTTRQYKIVSGTRRVTLRDYDGGWYGSNAFRECYHNFFKDRLPKGAEIFYEIVGWVNENTTIMGRCSNKLVKDKEFSKQYGAETVFSYGCEVGQNDCYVYRVTLTNGIIQVVCKLAPANPRSNIHIHPFIIEMIVGHNMFNLIG